MKTASLFVAIYAAVVATTAVVWQILAFTRTGSRVEVEPAVGIFVDGSLTSTTACG